MSIFRATPWYVDFIVFALGIVLFLSLFKSFASDLLYIGAAIFLGWIWFYNFTRTIFYLWLDRKKAKP